MRARRPTRLKGFSYIGFCRYHLRFRTGALQNIFMSHDRVARSLAEIVPTSAIEGFVVLAYCFMPDHVHLIVEGTTVTANLRRFAKLSKQRMEYVLRRDHRLSEIWQEGYFDRVIRTDDALERTIRYALDNPVRAGLVAKAEDYPFSGALYWPVATRKEIREP